MNAKDDIRRLPEDERESYLMTSGDLGHDQPMVNSVDLFADFPAQDSANVVEQEDTPPNGGYGWVCVACVFLINANTWGVNSVRLCIMLIRSYSDTDG